MWPEAGWFYKDRSILDLALSSPDNSAKNDFDTADVALEMKWGGVDRNGNLFSNSFKTLYKDCVKMIENCMIDNKYFMQFIVIENDELEISKTSLRKNIKEKIDDIKVRPIFCDYFKTQGYENDEYWRFYIITWKVSNETK